MNREDSDKLLEKLLDEESLAGLRRATLDSGLNHIRRRRIRRHVLRGAALMCLLSFAFAGMYQGWFNPQSTSKGVASRTNPADAQHPDVEIINDDQLFALFPNRPVALVGSPGHQQLVFLDTAGSPGPALQR